MDSKKNPKYHSNLENILGKNYILFFDEKRNKRANPPKIIAKNSPHFAFIVIYAKS